MKALFLTSLMLIAAWADNPMMEKFQANEEVLISSRVSHDLYLAGNQITINAPVDGDVMAGGGTILIRDSIADDLVLAGGEITIDGVIGEDLLMMGGNVKLMQPVRGDLIVMGGDITVGENVSIGQNLVVFGGQVRSDALVGGDVLARGGTLRFGGSCEKMLDVQGGNVSVSGTVKGETKIAAETISIGNNARFYSTVHYWTEEGEVNFGESLMDGIQAQYDVGLAPGEESFWNDQPWNWIPLLFIYLGSVLLLIFLIHTFLSKAMEKGGNVLYKETARSFGYGVLYYVGAPLVIVLMLMTVIGIPLGLFSLFLYIFSVLFGLTFSSVVITFLVRNHYHYDWGKGMLIAVSFVIFILLRVLSMIPFLGFMLVGLMVGAAIGALILSFFQKDKSLQTQTV